MRIWISARLLRDPAMWCGLTVVLQRQSDSSVQNRSVSGKAPLADEETRLACPR